MRVDFTPDPRLFPFESRFYESSVGRVHYIDEGSGTPLLLLHGNPTWSFLYRKIIPRLQDSFRCIAVDYPGFGLSDHPDGYGYTPEEHARVIGELVDHLDLDGFLFMVQDWGGPIGFDIATKRADRVRGIVHGNTWFWPVDTLMFKIFPRVMSTGFMQRQIVQKNFFVERIMPRSMVHKLSQAEMDHYRRVQPTPEARVGVAEFPRQILKAEPLLARLEHDVPRLLGTKPVVFVWGMKDPAFRPKATLPKARAAFSDHEVVEMHDASHYIQEDAPEAIADAIRKRFL
ncbi:MAG TPA: alpha/beta fold hydrolase [Actinomycetota bacterium]|nr:alpha/beta fold hydrolase [Actinomycetota bacterium]